MKGNKGKEFYGANLNKRHTIIFDRNDTDNFNRFVLGTSGKGIAFRTETKNLKNISKKGVDENEKIEKRN